MARRAAKERIRDARQALYQEHILDAAEQIFAQSGYEEAKVVSVATAAGVSLATVYRSFETKWDIYRAIHARRIAALTSHVRARIAEEDGTLERMLAGISAYIEFHMQHPHYLRMHLRDGYAWSSPRLLQRSPEQTEAWNEGLAMATRAFETGIREGLYLDEESPEFLARTMIAMHQVRLADWVERGMKEPVETVADAVHRQFLRTFCTARAAATDVKTRAAARPRPRRRAG